MDRAIALAALAGETEIERLLDGVTLPALLNRAAVQHLEQQARAPARRVALLARRHVTRAHDALLAVDAPARADADAAPRRLGEAAVILEIGEVVVDLGRLIERPDAEIG